MLSPDCTCPAGATSCTDLLYQPVRVLRNRQLWPVSLCYDASLRESTQRWYSRVALLTGALGYLGESSGKWALERMAESWPLPVGRQAISLRAAMFRGDETAYLAALRMASFEGREEALWAIRVTLSGSTLDLFGLADRSADATLTDEDGPVSMCGLRYILRGSDTFLVEIVRAAERWWSDFRGLKVQGRPPNSGAWADADEFKDALRSAITDLRKQGRVATQQEATTYFCIQPGFPGCDDRQLRPRRAVEALRSHKAAQNAERLKLGDLWEDNNLVFCTMAGKALYFRNGARGSFKPLLKKAGLPDFGSTTSAIPALRCYSSAATTPSWCKSFWVTLRWP